MNNNDTAAAELHDRQANSICLAVAKLLPTFEARGFTPEAVFEGAIKGAAITMLEGRGLTAPEVGDLLAGFAEAFRNNEKLGRGKLHVVE